MSSGRRIHQMIHAAAITSHIRCQRIALATPQVSRLSMVSPDSVFSGNVKSLASPDTSTHMPGPTSGPEPLTAIIGWTWKRPGMRPFSTILYS